MAHILADAKEVLDGFPSDDGDKHHIGQASEDSAIDEESLELSPEEQKAITRKILLKCDLRIIPILTALVLLAFLDRFNIANARIEGLTKDLNLRSNQYNIVVTAFSITYCIFELPSNLALRRFRPGRWLCFLMFSWGVCALGQGLTHNFSGLFACRFLMGAFEAGFIPGCLYLMGAYYKRHELQTRFTYFFAGEILAAAFSAFLAYLLEKMNGVGGYAGWRWIFIIEGLLTIVVACASWWLIVPWPEDCTFLDATEKAVLHQRLEEDSGIAKMNRLDRKAVIRVLKDWKIWIMLSIYLPINSSAGAVAYFTPTILVGLGYRASEAQIHAIPIYMATLITAFAICWASDRLKHRSSFLLFSSLLEIIGWAIQLSPNPSTRTRYAGVFLITIGAFTRIPTAVVWLMNLMGGHYKRALGTALVIGGGNIGGFIGANVFLPAQAHLGPQFYRTGFAVCLALTCFATLMVAVLVGLLRWENGVRERGERDERLRLPRTEVENLGDDHPGFRFML